MRRKLVRIMFIALVLVLVTILPGAAQSTSKSLSTNFTLVNLSSAEARGDIQYYRPDGGEWRSSEPFTLAGNGGQQQFRQYFDDQLPAGRGSVIVSANQSLGAVVQVKARNQNPTSNGAYSGYSAGAASFYVPLAARNKTTASGRGNSQIVVQNSGSAATDFEIRMVNPNGTTQYVRPYSALQPGASDLYDLASENQANVPNEWIGSAVVTATSAGGEIAVVSNFFTGDAMQTFNAFSANSPGTKWLVPQFNSRLSNSLSTVIVVQNLSGGPIAANAITINCKKLDGSGPFTMSNPDILGDTASFSFNPVVNVPPTPSDYEGSCIVDSPANIVVFVQMRFVATGEAAAWEAFKPGVDTMMVVPLVAKRLSNGFSTVITIQNLDEVNPAEVTLSYVPSSECLLVPPCSVVSFDATIAAGGSLMQNLRITSGPNSVPAIPEGWTGSLTVRAKTSSTPRPIAGFTQLTFLRSVNPSLPGGDNFMAHDNFSVTP